ncbi:o-succinylbenzoate synthase [Flavobacteriaceae bacterium]|jgi:o-succinylbenzoate synthase|nr:o-succinylbenzoate synthase [Flavobacteriaceae bacterium]
MEARYFKHSLQFKRPSGTSRGILINKYSWFIEFTENDKKGVGECSLLSGLSYDDTPGFENQLALLCSAINQRTPLPDLQQWPAIRMGYEMALLDLAQDQPFELYPSDFSNGKDCIPINGLVWMGTFDYMSQQIKSLLEKGFDCIKLKIGAIHFEEELALLTQIRKEFDAKEVKLRVDANGAFAPGDALEKLKRLSDFDLHSIEQPIAANQWQAMRYLSEKSPLPIALDEELIGRFSEEECLTLLDVIQPAFIILKPSLLGGFRASSQWIQWAERQGIGWWVTSALESNVGLNAIAQWTYQQEYKGHQGLGTGSLFTNNFESPLVIKKGCLWVDNLISWNKLK